MTAELFQGLVFAGDSLSVVENAGAVTIGGRKAAATRLWRCFPRSAPADDPDLTGPRGGYLFNEPRTQDIS